MLRPFRHPVAMCWHFQTWVNNTQHVTTYSNTVAKHTQHVAPNNVVICYVGMLRSLAGALVFMLMVLFSVQPEFGNVDFCKGTKNLEPRAKCSKHIEVRTNNKLNPRTYGTRIKPGYNYGGISALLPLFLKPSVPSILLNSELSEGSVKCRLQTAHWG